MKLRNKKTGEIRKSRIFNGHFQMWSELLNDWVDYDDIDYLAEYWERYEEPKEHYFITEYGEVYSLNEYEGLNNVANPEDYKSIGNYFETQEEAEKVVEKLKAWKRLKDKGFRFKTWGWENRRATDYIIWFTVDDLIDDNVDFAKDLDLLFGGEE